ESVKATVPAVKYIPLPSFAMSVGSFFFQAEDGIRARNVTAVQTCALPICFAPVAQRLPLRDRGEAGIEAGEHDLLEVREAPVEEIGRASCRERVGVVVVRLSVIQPKTSL